MVCHNDAPRASPSLSSLELCTAVTQETSKSELANMAAMACTGLRSFEPLRDLWNGYYRG
jgi:hypothetical protein